MIVNILITIVMGWIASSASICLKLATSGEKLSVAGLLRNKWLYFGGMLYVIAALLNIYLLKKLPYSVVVPLGALTYVWTMFLSRKVLGEPVTRSKVFGISIILIGVIMLVISNI